MQIIFNLLRNIIWNALLFFNHSSIRLTRPKTGGAAGGASPDAPGGGVSGRIIVSLHRNGMMDLFLSRYIWPEVVALTSVQWHRNFLTRWLIGGVGVSRAKDRGKDHKGDAPPQTSMVEAPLISSSALPIRDNDDASRAASKIQTENTQAMKKCAELLRQGRAVGIAPEGTSQLGPGHLPFQKAAARVAAKVLEKQGEVRVLPASPVYLQAWAWRSPAELYAGPELVFTAGEKMNDIHREISRALEAVTLKADSLDALMDRQAAAWELCAFQALKGASGQSSPTPAAMAESPLTCGDALPLRGGETFSSVLLESPDEMLDEIAGAHKRFAERLPSEALFYGVIAPDALNDSAAEEFKPQPLTLALYSALSLLGGAARLLAWPPLYLSRRLRRPLVDDLNVVALWRGLIALPLIGLWGIALGLAAAWLWGPPGALIFLILGLAAIILEPERLRLKAAVLAVETVGRSELRNYFNELMAIKNKYRAAENQKDENA
ncbi:1-acyl-sn-glycerol-3-phosphate acyltransferase [Deltaproteobacteria bacterium OttesenSCG-928-K17]|nr:1-acyl-sn-glycerol-3-phosphate acyltransferase [Deltaproteobacteria bacterium OttesenSCG-928-K17]